MSEEVIVFRPEPKETWDWKIYDQEHKVYYVHSQILKAKSKVFRAIEKVEDMILTKETSLVTLFLQSFYSSRLDVSIPTSLGFTTLHQLWLLAMEYDFYELESTLLEKLVSTAKSIENTIDFLNTLYPLQPQHKLSSQVEETKGISTEENGEDTEETVLDGDFKKDIRQIAYDEFLKLFMLEKYLFTPQILKKLHKDILCQCLLHSLDKPILLARDTEENLLPIEILGRRDGNKYHVHFIGWRNDWDTSVTKIWRFKEDPKGHIRLGLIRDGWVKIGDRSDYRGEIASQFKIGIEEPYE